jgi:hypothetical protein
MIPRIKDVKVKEDYVLLVFFDNNTVKEYDMKPLLKDKRFELLKDKIIFSMVQVDAGGYGISWNDDIDLSEHEIWINGSIVN